jgi:hypothetical protein
MVMAEYVEIIVMMTRVDINIDELTGELEICNHRITY